MIEDKMDEMITRLNEILTWIRFSEFKNVKEILLTTLEDDMAKIVYHYSDGEASRKIAKKIPVSHATIHNYWKRWSEIGIVESFKTRGGIGYKRIFSLEFFGIEIPEFKKTTR